MLKLWINAPKNGDWILPKYKTLPWGSSCYYAVPISWKKHTEGECWMDNWGNEITDADTYYEFFLELTK